MRIYFAAAVLALAMQCRPAAVVTQPPVDNAFGRGVPHEITCAELTEASGLVASRENTGVFWSHNDSGGQNALFAFDSTGKYLAELVIPDANNRDWEDIAAGPGPESGKQYLYIGDIGDNLSRYDRVTVYRVPEPVLAYSGTPLSLTSGKIASIQLRYPDGAHDSETLLCDPITGDLYIITKREKQAMVYRSRFPQDTEKLSVLEKVTEFPLTGIVSGDISPDGSQLLLKTYTVIYRWQVNPGAPFKDFDPLSAMQLPYEREPQGEAVAWDAHQVGYHTISEKSGSWPVYLFSYEPLKSGNSDE